MRSMAFSAGSPIKSGNFSATFLIPFISWMIGFINASLTPVITRLASSLKPFQMAFTPSIATPNPLNANVTAVTANLIVTPNN